MELRAFGKTYRRKTVLCKKVGITEEAFQYYHSHKGYSVEEAIILSKNAIIEFGGHEYHSLRELCSNYGVTYTTVLARLKSGLSINESLSATYHSKKSNYNEVTVCGVLYKNRTEFLKDTNIQYNFFQKYMKDNSLDEATALHNLTILRNEVANKSKNNKYNLYRIPLAMINGVCFEYLGHLSRIINVTTSGLRTFKRRHEDLDIIEVVKAYQIQTLQESVKEIDINMDLSIDLVKLNEELLRNNKIEIPA